MAKLVLKSNSYKPVKKSRNYYLMSSIILNIIALIYIILTTI